MKIDINHIVKVKGFYGEYYQVDEIYHNGEKAWVLEHCEEGEEFPWIVVDTNHNYLGEYDEGEVIA